MSPDLVFVYGTLKRGHGNHATMVRAKGRFVGTATTVQRFPLVVAGLPYLIDQTGTGHRVQGELFRIPDGTGWSILDRLEGHPEFYQRRVITCELNELSIEAWTYFIQGEVARFAGLPFLPCYEDPFEA